MSTTSRSYRRARAPLALGTCAALLLGVATVAAGKADAAKPVVLVQAKKATAPMSARLTGVNNDQWWENSHGLWDPASEAPPDGAPNPQVAAKTERAGIGIVRYPGGTPASFFDWEKAVGPTEARGFQTDAFPGQGECRDSVYGPDEQMEFVEEAGAEASIMAGFIKQTPEEAADWVRYMNATSGERAVQRAANGHPEPYGVRYWEVGNEHDRPDQRYWMSADNETALVQYAFGGTQVQEQPQVLGRGCDYSPDVASDGSANQVFGIPYPPVVPDSQALTVGGQPWTETTDLGTVGPDDTVYEVNDATGEVRFGDGVRGAIPPAGEQVVAETYSSGPHAGFVDFYAAMKEADPSIDVCATWASIGADTGLGGLSFPELMAREGMEESYDCLVVHPYTNFRRQFWDGTGAGPVVEDAQQLHDWHMLGEGEATDLLTYHASTVEEFGDGDAYVTASEFGALFFGQHNAQEYLSWNTAMSHATYMASQWTRLAALGVPWAEGNTLVSEAPQGLRAVLGGQEQFVFTSDAVVREAMKPMVAGGGDVVRNRVQDNPVIQTDEEPVSSATPTSYEALTTTATVDDDGDLNIMVVNRDSTNDIAAQVVPAGYRHSGTATVSSVIGENSDPNRESFESHNSRGHPNEVSIRRSTVDVGGGAFAYTFGKHSVTLIELSPR